MSAPITSDSQELIQKCNDNAPNISHSCIIIMSMSRSELAQPVLRGASRHTWKAEFEWYRKNFHKFLHASLLGPIAVIFCAAPYVVPRQNTIITAITWGIVGGFSITIGEWVTEPFWKTIDVCS